MGKIISIILLITFTNLFPQGWNAIVETTIPFYPGTASKVDMFTNKDGIHIVVRYYQYPPGTDIFKYYLINTSGTVIRNTDIEVPGNVEFPNISGDDNIVYIVYKLGSNLKAKKSTDAGQTWSDIPLLPIGNNNCNGVDIVYGDNGLHVVYAMQDNGSDYETYYYKLNSSDQWVDYKNVTDFDANEVGGFPTVTVSANRVHVGYNTGNQSDPEVNQGIAKSRDKYNNDWQDPQVVFGSNSMIEKIFAGSTKLFDFYYELGTGFPHADLYVKERSFSGTNWSTPYLIQATADVNRIDAANTSDGKTHIVYPGAGSILYKYYESGTWSSTAQTIGDWYEHPNISAVSNDLYVIYGSSNNFIKYRHYDAAPLTPQNFAVSVYHTQYDSYPKLTWDLNNEPDVRENNQSGYIIERRIRESEFNQIATVSGTTSVYIDYTVHYAGSGIG